MYKYEFDEIIKLVDKEFYFIDEIPLHEEGIIIGKAVDEDGSNAYAIAFYKHPAKSYFPVYEDQIESTGRFEPPDPSESDEPSDSKEPVANMKVRINDQGEGIVVGYEDYEDPSNSWSLNDKST